jgi:hypothetical protein
MQEPTLNSIRVRMGFNARRSDKPVRALCPMQKSVDSTAYA